jgi:L-amino acid N-acyltransferase YncA
VSRIQVPTIRNAAFDDLADIIRIYNAAISGKKAVADAEPITVESRVEWFLAHNDSRRPLWVLELDGQMAGWISLQSYSTNAAFQHTAEVSLFVDDEFQGNGYGTFLLGSLLAKCSTFGIETLMGVCFADNERVIALNQRLGLRQWGRLRQVANICGELRDLVIMGINLERVKGRMESE